MQFRQTSEKIYAINSILFHANFHMRVSIIVPLPFIHTFKRQKIMSDKSFRSHFQDELGLLLYIKYDYDIYYD